MALLLQFLFRPLVSHRLPWLERTWGLARLALLGLPFWLGTVESQQPAAPEGVQRIGGIVYRLACWQSLRLDLYVPDTPAPPGGRPLLVAIHGGGWRGGNRVDYGSMMARFAQAGIVVASVDYRLSRRGSPGWPGNLADVQAAVRWLREHADQYAIDPCRIAAIGSSAGGHLAALLGVPVSLPTELPGPPVLLARAVVDFYGPSDLPRLIDQPYAGEAVKFLLGGTPEELVQRAHQASPAARVQPGSAPMLLLYGEDDQTVPVAQGVALAEALQDAGVRHCLRRIPGARHGFGLIEGAHDFVPEILAFLQATWDHE